MSTHSTGLRWLRELVSLMLGILVATKLVTGISYTNNYALAAVVIVLALLNVVLRPFLRRFLMFLSLPLVLLTFGLVALLVLWVVNSVLFYLAAILVNFFQIMMFGNNIASWFNVETFGDAMLGSLVVSITSWVISALLGESKKSRKSHDDPPPPGGKKHLSKDDDVIDV
jgi:putative membrane protein